MAQGHRPLRRTRLGLAVLEAFEHLDLAKVRNDVAGWCVEVEFALLNKLHCGRPRDGFGHGGDPADGVGGHRHALADDAFAEPVLIDRFVRGRDGGDDARYIAIRHAPRLEAHRFSVWSGSVCGDMAISQLLRPRSMAGGYQRAVGAPWSLDTRSFNARAVSMVATGDAAIFARFTDARLDAWRARYVGDRRRGLLRWSRRHAARTGRR